MSSARSTLKAVIEFAATASGAAALARRLNANGVAIIAYHNIVPDTEAGHGESSLHLRFSDFIQQLDWIEQSFDVIGPGSLFDPPTGHRPRVLVTFDDAYRGAVTVGLPELARRRMHSVMFVAPGILGETGMWWDELAEQERLDERAREHAIRALQGRNEAVRRWAGSGSAAPSFAASYGIATGQELAAACGAFSTVAAHGWSHASLPDLDPAELSDELHRSRSWLTSWGGDSIPWLALPYGRGSSEVTAKARQHGFNAVLEIDGGRWNGHAEFVLPRINIPAGISVRGLALRASGLLH